MKVDIKHNKSFIGSNDLTILESALKSNVYLEYSCKSGRCGICKTELLEGEVTELHPQIALNDLEKQSDIILTCCCAPKSNIVLNAEDLIALKGIETKTLPVRISVLKKHTFDIIEVILRFPPSITFEFLNGQYLDVIQNNIRRSYSIASTSNQKEIRLLVKRFDNGKMSNYLFNYAQENDLLRVEGPKGTFFLRDKTEPLLFLATGTGIAPVISILKGLDENPDYQQQNPISLYWGNRYPDEFLWQPNFKKIDVEFFKVCSKPGADWKGETGHVQNIAIKRQLGIVNCAVYACGSNSMIQSAKSLFTQVGLPETQFYSDAFIQSY